MKTLKDLNIKTIQDEAPGVGATVLGIVAGTAAVAALDKVFNKNNEKGFKEYLGAGATTIAGMLVKKGAKSPLMKAAGLGASVAGASKIASKAMGKDLLKGVEEATMEGLGEAYDDDDLPELENSNVLENQLLLTDGDEEIEDAIEGIAGEIDNDDEDEDEDDDEEDEDDDDEDEDDDEDDI